MPHKAIHWRAGTRIRDDRYGTVFELISKASGARGIGIAYVEVDPGKESPAHFHEATEEVYCFVEGTGVMTVDTDTFDVGPGDVVYLPLRSVHSIRNTSAVPLCFISADAPPYDPEDDTEVQ